MALSKTKIRALKPKTVKYAIADSRGLSLLVRPTGALSWIYRYWLLGKPGEVNLGRYPHISVAQARERRNALAAGITAGQSPAEQRRIERASLVRGITVNEFAERYLREYAKRVRRDITPIRRSLARDICPVLGAMTIAQVQPEHIRDLVFKKRDDGFGMAAVAIRNLLKRLFDYAVVCGAATSNPAQATPIKFIAQPTSRTRALNDSELGVFLQALDAASIKNEFKIALKLILLTLTRKAEVIAADWHEFDLERAEWTIPEERSKTKAGQIVYLSRQATELLGELKSRAHHSYGPLFCRRCSWFYPVSPSTLNKALSRIPLKTPHFTVHDLRRSAATRLSEMEYSADVIEKALNHKLPGVRGIYNRAKYATQRREMLQAWADHIDFLREKAEADNS